MIGLISLLTIGQTSISNTGITGTLTANYAPKALAKKKIGNSSIYFNGVNVGINTTTNIDGRLSFGAYKTTTVTPTMDQLSGHIKLYSNSGTDYVGVGVTTNGVQNYFNFVNTLFAANYSFYLGSTKYYEMDNAGLSFLNSAGIQSQVLMKGNYDINWKGTYIPNVVTPSSSQQASHIKFYDDGTNYFGIGATTGTTIDGVTSQSSLNIACNQTGYGNICLYTDNARRLTVKPNGVINFGACPTSSVGLVTGDIWSNSGVLSIIP